MRHPMRRFYGDSLRDAAADVVPDEAGAIDAEQVEQDEEAIGVRFDVERQVSRRVAAAVAEKIEHDDAASFREQRDQLLPEMGRRRETVNEHQRLAATSMPGGVVVEACAADVEEFAAHYVRACRPMVRICCSKSEVSLPAERRVPCAASSDGAGLYVDGHRKGTLSPCRSKLCFNSSPGMIFLNCGQKSATMWPKVAESGRKAWQHPCHWGIAVLAWRLSWRNVFRPHPSCD